MKKGRMKPAEYVAGTVLAILIFISGWQGGKAVQALPYWESDSWQETQVFEQLLNSYVAMVLDLVDSHLQMNDGSRQLSYLERRQMEDRVVDLQKALDAENTAFRYQLRSGDGKTLYYKSFEDETLENVVENVRYGAFSGKRNVDMESTVLEDSYNSFEDTVTAPILDEQGSYILECGVASQPAGDVEDDFFQLYQYTMTCREQFPAYTRIAAALAMGAGMCFLLLMWLTARRAMTTDCVPAWLDRIYLELLLLVAVVIIGVALYGGYVLVWFSFHIYPEDWENILRPLAPLAFGAISVIVVGTCVLLLHTLLVRLCMHTFTKQTLIFHIIALVRRTFALLPAIWRVLIGFALFFFLNLMVLFSFGNSVPLFLLWLGVNLLVLLYLCRWTVCFRKLREGGRTIAAGNLNHRIDSMKMPGDLAEYAEDLNNIYQGLSVAVDEKMKSERFKAELITNVSHDLKTPLTSIINYVSLLKTTNQTDPKAVEYIEVLDRKSQRLKKLTEDLVEASKASTGVLTVHREKIGMAQLLSQAMGEWEEKLNDKGLSVVTNLPEGETWVYADGRHLWRVIDNLLSNCCKYAMEGTRIYIDLNRSHGQVALAVKNVSREALNIPAERLMERFVRGEESRSTEGSGLGLSIARSLTELQGGTFKLSVDGDLFKATVALPQAT